MRQLENNVLRSVKVKRTALIDKVKANRVQHQVAFEEARADFLMAMKRISEKNIAIVDHGDPTKLDRFQSYPAAPRSYEKEYLKALAMLEMSVEDELEIDAHTFNQLVLDDWEWKNTFLTTNSSYKGLL